MDPDHHRLRRLSSEVVGPDTEIETVLASVSWCGIHLVRGGTRQVQADGRARPVQTEGCSGSEVAFWSADNQRVFLNSELNCENGVKRQASGVFAITGSDTWMSVQAVTIDDRTATRSVRYFAVEDAVAPAAVRSALNASSLTRSSARIAALAPVDAADVDEAVTRIDAAAVQE